MSVLDTVKTRLVREPRQRRLDWMPVVWGSFMMILSSAGVVVGAEQGEPFRSEPEFGILGFAFVCMGGAELLPVDRRGASALLRALAIPAFVSYLVVFVLTF